MIEFSVNIDHVATLRNARGGREPSPLQAAFIAYGCGVDGITFHLREDRRHIRDDDVFEFKKHIPIKLNFEMAATKEMQNIALRISPYKITLVPERREERTTESGLNVRELKGRLSEYIKPFKERGIKVFLFVDPIPEDIEISKEIGADGVELHTGGYSEAFLESEDRAKKELDRLFIAAEKANEFNLVLCAGHGLNYVNIHPVLKLPRLYEVSIGHAIISRAVFVGLEKAIKEMLDIVKKV